jgi:hypothetical protein
MFAHTDFSIRAQIKVLQFKTKNTFLFTHNEFYAKRLARMSSGPILYLCAETKE